MVEFSLPYKSKAILVLSDDAGSVEKIKQVLEPMMEKKLVFASSAADAFLKIKSQEFDAVILRMLYPILGSDKSLYLATQNQEKKFKTPWIILGDDIESQDVLVSYPGIIKFASKAWTESELSGLLSALFLDKDVAAKSAVYVQFINPFISAVFEVLKTMGQIELAKGAPPSIRQNDNSSASKAGVSGLITIASDKFSGSLAITFQQSLILKAYENMMGEQKSSIDDDIKDSVMEMTNIIFGNAKRDLNKLGHTIQPAIPSVISGANHEIRHSQKGVILSLPFSSSHGNLTVECVISVLDK